MKSQHLCSPFARALRANSSRVAYKDIAQTKRYAMFQRHGSQQARDAYRAALVGPITHP